VQNWSCWGGSGTIWVARWTRDTETDDEVSASAIVLGSMSVAVGMSVMVL